MTRHTILVLLALAADGCSGCTHDTDFTPNDAPIVVGDGGGAGDGMVVSCITGLTSIAVSPVSQTVNLDGTNPAMPVTFTATGTFSDGHMAALDATQLAWTATRADDTPPGTISAGVLSPNPSAGGVVSVTASDSCASGAAMVTFLLKVVVGTPGDPNAWMGTPTTMGTTPTIVYPSGETRFPRNIYRTLFQWRANGHNQFRLTFTGPGATVTVFTSGVHTACAAAMPAAGCWEADELAWSYIAASNAGQTVTWTVDALDTTTMPATVRRAGPINIGFSRRDVKGAIFYWSTTSAGVRRANVADQFPEDYITGKPGTAYTSPVDQVKCVACHVVSRDGKYMAAPVDATTGQSLWVLEVTAKAPPNPLVKTIPNTKGHGFATISPDDKTVVAAWAGKMWSVDRATGAFIENLPLGAVLATQPDWSPDDTQLVFATGSNDSPSGASLAVIPWTNNMWGVPTTLVPAAGLSNLFPMFSPDGKWIAYSRGKGGHGDITAQLFIVGGKGGTPVELLNANRVVSNVLGNGQTENSQPTWGPPGDYDWIAFNSKRPYGVVSAAGTQQIWVAAVDPSKLGGGMDPSFPAFRLQFQGLAENNHRAYWTLDVREPTDGGVPPPADLGRPGDAMCIATGMICDPVADSCCVATEVCDTMDNGMTYTCTNIIGERGRGGTR